MLFRLRKSQPLVRKPRPNHEEQSGMFRRSRTLTGSTSSKVTTAEIPRSQLSSPRLKEHELKKHRRLLGLGLVSLLVLSGLCIWLLDQYISSVELSPSTPTLQKAYDQTPYQQTIYKYMNTRPLERFRFALNIDKLTQYVQDAHTEVASLHLEGADGLSATSGVITFRRPVVVWQADAQRYYVDAGGETFKKNMYAEPSVEVKDESGVKVDASQAIASSRLLSFLGQTVGGINASGIGTVKQVTIPGGTLRELDIYLDTHPYRIKTNMDRDAVGQVTDIISTVRYLDANKIVPSYVDARVSAKAFYQ